MFASACGHNPFKDIPIYKEIPFLDGPEMMWMNTVSDKEGILNPAETEEIKPQLLCVDADGWFQIKTGWLEACRYLQEDCSAKVESVQEIVDELNAKAEAVLEGRP